MHPEQDSHSTDAPRQAGPILWIIIGLVSVVVTFVGIISLVPKGY